MVMLRERHQVADEDWWLEAHDEWDGVTDDLAVAQRVDRIHGSRGTGRPNAGALES